MSAKCFFDTNILIYANDSSTAEKQRIALQSAQQFSFWDAIIIAAARSAACTRLFSEDLNAGQVIAGVEVVNPFGGS